ncbi:MAG: MBL fold metallo-hydrolase [Candidatus Nezhaarchaeales archaeon]
MKLKSGLYYYPETGFTSNSYLIENDVRILVDPGHHNHFRDLAELMREDGFELKDLDWVIVTHAHVDHCGAVHEIQKLFKVKVAMHEAEKEYLYESSERIHRLIGEVLIPFVVDYWIKGDKSVGLENLNLDIVVFHTPGHTPGSISIYSPSQKYLITGDLIFQGGVGRTDLGGNSNLLKRSIEQVSQLNVEMLLPGHGPIVVGTSNVLKNFKLVKELLELF